MTLIVGGKVYQNPRNQAYQKYAERYSLNKKSIQAGKELSQKERDKLRQESAQNNTANKTPFELQAEQTQLQTTVTPENNTVVSTLENKEKFGSFSGRTVNDTKKQQTTSSSEADRLSRFQQQVEAQQQREQQFYNSPGMKRIEETANVLTGNKPYEERGFFGKTAQLTVQGFLGAPEYLGGGIVSGAEKVKLGIQGLSMPETRKSTAREIFVTAPIETIKTLNPTTPSGAAAFTSAAIGGFLFPEAGVKARSFVSRGLDTTTDVIGKVGYEKTPTKVPIKDFLPKTLTKEQPTSQRVINMRGQPIDTITLIRKMDFNKQPSAPTSVPVLTAKGTTSKVVISDFERASTLKEAYVADARKFYAKQSLRNSPTDILEENYARVRAEKIILRKQEAGKVDATGRRLLSSKERTDFLDMIKRNKQTAERSQKNYDIMNNNNDIKLPKLNKRGSIGSSSEQEYILIKRPSIKITGKPDFFPLSAIHEPSVISKNIVSPKQNINNLPKEEQKSYPEGILKPVSSSAYYPISSYSPKRAVIPKQNLQFAPSLITFSLLKENVPSFGKLKYEPGGGGLGGGSSYSRVGKRNSKYAPSLLAVELGIKAKKTGGKKPYGYSGLEVRGI